MLFVAAETAHLGEGARLFQRLTKIRSAYLHPHRSGTSGRVVKVAARSGLARQVGESTVVTALARTDAKKAPGHDCSGALQTTVEPTCRFETALGCVSGGEDEDRNAGHVEREFVGIIVI